jgi:enamine deaminase RidA (YjgF/YER057c/UK114 family)
MPRANISTGSVYEQKVGYSRAVRIGQHVAVAGTTSMKDGLQVGEDDPAEQTRVMLDTIAWALNEAGASVDDIIRYRVYLADVTHWPVVAPILHERLGHIRPTNTLIGGVTLVDPKMLVEIEADAIVDAD